MRIAFDTAPLARPYPPGVARAARGLVEALEARDDVELVRLAPAPGASELSWRQLRLPGLLERARVLGLHSPLSAFPFRGPGRRVQTVHELPWRHGVRENAGPVHRLWARYGVARADAVLCPTERVRADLLAECGGGAPKVHACPWGVELGPAPDAGARAALRAELGLGARAYALALGATRPKKDLAAGLRALAHRRDRGLAPLALVVTGAPTAQLARDLELARGLGLADDVLAVGAVEEARLAALVAEASAVLVLSGSEGFGFPALEALAQGTPAVVAEAGAPAEVCGAAAITADPANAASVVAALERALAVTSGGREALRARAAELGWARCARQVAELWGGWA